MYIKYLTKATHVEKWGIRVPDSLEKATDKELRQYIRENAEDAEFLDFVDTYNQHIEEIESREAE